MARFLSITIPSTTSVSNLHRIFSVSLKHGPVMLTIVPPNMFPLSGAYTRGKFVPAVTYAIVSSLSVLDPPISLAMSFFDLTDILVASSQHDPFVYSEDVTSWKTVRPSSSGQVANRRHLGVRLVFVALGAVSGVEANLRAICDEKLNCNSEW